MREKTGSAVGAEKSIRTVGFAPRISVVGVVEAFFAYGRGKRDQPLVALGVSFCLLDRDLLGRRRIVGSLGDFATGLPGDGARLAAGEGA